MRANAQLLGSRTGYLTRGAPYWFLPMFEPEISASETARASDADPVPAIEALQILVVDDNPADRLMYRILLPNSAERAFGIVEVDNCESALAACRMRRPDCILLDFNLPDMDGLEFMAAVKAEFGELPCPIVMLTGVRDERTAVRAMKLGAADYIPKSDNLAEALERAIVGAIEK